MVGPDEVKELSTPRAGPTIEAEKPIASPARPAAINCTWCLTAGVFLIEPIPHLVFITSPFRALSLRRPSLDKGIGWV